LSKTTYFWCPKFYFYNLKLPSKDENGHTLWVPWFVVIHGLSVSLIRVNVYTKWTVIKSAEYEGFVKLNGDFCILSAKFNKNLQLLFQFVLEQERVAQERSDGCATAHNRNARLSEKAGPFH